jgi:predicted nucleic acid-binding protein
MIGLDCNILVQLAIADHPLNAKTIAKVTAETQRGEKFVFPPLVATEFLHIVTDPRRFAPPLTMNEASAWLKRFLSNPSVALIYETLKTLDQTLDWMQKLQLGRKRILDTHLASILYTNGVARLLTSNPADFKIFTEIEVLSPES